VATLETLYGVSLVRPQLECLGQLKKFCMGLVEKDVTHLWWESCSSLSAQSRFGLSHSLFLFRKVIPGEKPLVSAYVEKLGTPQESPDAEFVAFARKLVRKIFRPGWDRTYQDACLSSSLPLTSCSEAGRKLGGCRGISEQEWESRADFCSYVLKSVTGRTRGVSRVQAIETGGKWRIISIPPLVDNALRPLHKAMYSRLSQFKWLLRGDAKAARFKDFTPVDGEVFVSGDYESATDNLNAELQVIIMDELLERSYTVPQGIRDHARSIYRSALDGGGVQAVQQRGQLMGQLTSFPLLCLVNYITFRYSVPRDSVPVRINGDDIVFRATPDEVSCWERNVAKGGLTLSLGKTLKHSRAFTLNSTPFWSTGKGGRLVGFLRSSSVFPSKSVSEQVLSLNGRFYSACSGYGGRRKRVVRELFLLHNQKPIFASRRSVTRGLQLAVDEGMLRDLGLWQRELFYLEQVDEPLLPVATPGLPPGWRQVGSSWMDQSTIDEWKRRWASACVDHSWTSPVALNELSEDSLMSRIRAGCSPFGLGSLIGARVRRMLGLSRVLAWKWVFARQNSSVFGRVRRNRGEKVWVEVDLLAPRSQVAFIAATGLRSE